MASNLRWRKPFQKDALRLLHIFNFSDANETKTSAVIIPFPFLWHDEELSWWSQHRYYLHLQSCRVDLHVFPN